MSNHFFHYPFHPNNRTRTEYSTNLISLISSLNPNQQLVRISIVKIGETRFTLDREGHFTQGAYLFTRLILSIERGQSGSLVNRH